MMNWNIRGGLSSLVWTRIQDQCSLFKRCEFLIPCHSGKTEQLPPKNLKSVVFTAMGLNSCAWLSTVTCSGAGNLSQEGFFFVWFFVCFLFGWFVCLFWFGLVLILYFSLKYFLKCIFACQFGNK